MELKKLDHALTVCKVAAENDIDLNKDFYFIGKTDEEYSQYQLLTQIIFL